LDDGSGAVLPQRVEHADLPLVVAVLLAEGGDQVALLELEGDEDGGGRDRGEEQPEADVRREQEDLPSP